MSKTSDAYKRGYNAAKHRNWPWWQIPNRIPDALYRELADAATALSVAADAMLCHFDDRDEDPHQLAIDAARERVRVAIKNALEQALESAS